MSLSLQTSSVMSDLCHWKLAVKVCVNISKHFVLLSKFWVFLFSTDLFQVYSLTWFWVDVHVTCGYSRSWWSLNDTIFVKYIELGEHIGSNKLSCEIVVNGNLTGSDTELELVLFPLEYFSGSDFFNMVDASSLYCKEYWKFFLRQLSLNELFHPLI